jgi:hypothetical protein
MLTFFQLVSYGQRCHKPSALIEPGPTLSSGTMSFDYDRRIGTRHQPTTQPPMLLPSDAIDGTRGQIDGWVGPGVVGCGQPATCLSMQFA